MKIQLNTFGTTLVSRQSGKEALAALRPALSSLPASERIEVDFSGIMVFSPSWGDEFLTPLLRDYGEWLLLYATDNPSVRATLEFLEETYKIHFQRSPTD